VFAVVAALTMTLGNLVAILQTNVKRFMAFSAISQAGYLLLGFMGRGPDAASGVSAMVFYALAYVVTNLAAFAVILTVVHQSGQENVSAFRGLSRTNPGLALALLVALFGLAGIPPLAGFTGKFFLFSVAAKAGYHWLVALAAVNSTVSLYYYLRIVREMYIEAPVAPDAAGRKSFSIPAVAGTALVVATLAAVALGVVPGVFGRISMDSIPFVAGLGLR
jgi:NADH-quinone oxidoreductase subunit N